MNTNRNVIEILGIDLGKTIVTASGGRADYPAFPDAFRVIRRLVAERFGDRIHIVSKVNAQQKQNMLSWIARHNFCAETGIPMERVNFCAERSDKAPICARLGVTHFIDDRPEVMSHIDPSVCRILFQPDRADFETFRNKLGDVAEAQSWLDIEKMLL